MVAEDIQAITTFWFGDDGDDVITASRQSNLWWSKNSALDLQIRKRFESTLQAATDKRLTDWESTPQGVLALVILHDQLPRNMYRETSRSFAFDEQARRFCRLSLQAGFYATLRPIERSFLHMPLMHSELLTDQEQAVTLAAALVEQVDASQKELFTDYLAFAVRHRDIIARFGRFPHRNQILKRRSTPQELAFLLQPGSSF